MSSATAPTFRYFPSASTSPQSTWTAEPHPCGGCGQVGPGFAGPYYGEQDVEFLCSTCLAGGRLGELEGSANSADRAELLTQLRERAPASAETLAEVRTRELEERTPHVTSWQDFLWPAHCGDYCAFEGEVGQRELAGLSPTGDGEAFFREHLHPSYREGTPDYAELVPPHAPGPGEEWSVGVWLLRCLTCARAVLLWDCD